MKINKKQSQGFSLVELMVAMVIGVIVVGGAFSMHSTSRSTQYASEMQMDMVADARFAIELIAYDLRQAGSWGATNKASLIECRTSDTSCPLSMTPAAVAGDCVVAPNSWAYDISTPIFATNGSNPYGTCIPSTEKYLAGTDVLDIRYADANPPTLTANQAYIRSNFTNGRIFVGATEPVLNAYNTLDLTKNHELHAYAYYVSSFTDDATDGIPSLRRVALVGGPALQNQSLVSGVADFQVQFGIDSTGDDQIIDRYVDADAIAAADWTKVYAAKIWLLMRSDKKQKPGVGKVKTFSMAGVDKTVGGPGDFRYFMVSSVVNLRNMKQQ